MPNRVVREAILNSEKVNALSIEAELFYRRSMSVVDDFGRFYAHPTLLRARVYPLKPEMYSEADIDAFLAQCKQQGLIRIYEVEGRRYLELTNFRQRTRSPESRFPAPPFDDAHDGGHRGGHDGSRDDSRCAHVDVDGDVLTKTVDEDDKTLSASAEAGVLSVDAPAFDTIDERASFQLSPTADSIPKGDLTEDDGPEVWRERFDAWWRELAWRRDGKMDAKSALEKAVRKLARSSNTCLEDAFHELWRLTEAYLKRFRGTQEWERWRKNLLPSTFLRGERWLDEGGEDGA